MTKKATDASLSKRIKSEQAKQAKQTKKDAKKQQALKNATIPEIPTKKTVKGRKQNKRKTTPEQVADAKEKVEKPEEIKKRLFSKKQKNQQVTEIVEDTPDVLVVPDVPDEYELVETDVIIPERAIARILYHKATNKYTYEVIEPQLDPEQEDMIKFIKETFLRALEITLDEIEDPEDFLRKSAIEVLEGHGIELPEYQLERVLYHLNRDFIGYGPIEIIMRDPMIEDISCDGPNIPVYVFHRQYRSLKTTIEFNNDRHLDSYVIRLAQRSGKHISIADPILDATLPDGSRLQTTLSREVTTRGSSFTIRRFKANPLTPVDLVKLGTFDARMAAWYWFAIEQGSGFIYAGGTASGKTTSLNAVCQFIPPEKKVVSIEDTREIRLNHENWIAGLTRSGFTGSGNNAINMYRLLEAALRQRPDYMIVGEVRGKEALTLFQAMATGHAVYSTMHADSVDSAVHRLENEPINTPRLMLSTLDAICIQIQVKSGGKHRRRVKEITELVDYDAETEELITNTVFEWGISDDKYNYLGRSAILDKYRNDQDLTVDQLNREWLCREELLKWLVKENIREFTQVSQIINDYYQQPNKVLDKAGLDIQSPLDRGPIHRDLKKLEQPSEPTELVIETPEAQNDTNPE